jgi:anthranilate synthase component I
VPAALVRDRESGRAWLTAEEGYEALLERFADDAGRAGTPPEWPGLVRMEEEDPARFEAAVTRALEYIAAGDVYQANLSRRWRGETRAPVSPASLYRRLRAANPSPFAALLCDGDFAVISSSPERLVSVQGGKVSTRPIAGTRPRGASAAEDAALIRSLIDNEKERAEHVMLIDLERNDLGRVCVGGSVVVDEYMAVETYAHVHHIVSNVSGRKLEHVSPIEIIRAMFPGGTITGCPKVRCMDIIAELEGVGRGAYTGSIGYLNRDGSCDFNILIRTMTAQGTSVSFRAGAGIVADSKPGQELAETRAKAEGLKRALA